MIEQKDLWNVSQTDDGWCIQCFMNPVEYAIFDTKQDLELILLFLCCFWGRLVVGRRRTADIETLHRLLSCRHSPPSVLVLNQRRDWLTFWAFLRLQKLADGKSFCCGTIHVFWLEKINAIKLFMQCTCQKIVQTNNKQFFNAEIRNKNFSGLWRSRRAPTDFSPVT